MKIISILYGNVKEKTSVKVLLYNISVFSFSVFFSLFRSFLGPLEFKSSGEIYGGKSMKYLIEFNSI